MKYEIPDCVSEEDEQTYTEYTEEVVFEGERMRKGETTLMASLYVFPGRKHENTR